MPNLQLHGKISKILSTAPANSKPYWQMPYDHQSAEVNKNHRREIEGIMKEAPKIHQMTATHAEEEQYDYDSKISQFLN